MMMKCARFLMAALLLGGAAALQAAPLRVFIRAGVKTHGPNQHDHPRFLNEYSGLLRERGLTVDGALAFPTTEQLDQTGCPRHFCGGRNEGAEGAERGQFEKFLRRGGGLVVIHDGSQAGQSSEDADWAKKVQGGAWRWQGEKKTIWHEGAVGLYFVDTEHPITRGISNFDWKDEIYNRLDMDPAVHVLADSFLDVFNIWPQLWTLDKRPGREGARPTAVSSAFPDTSTPPFRRRNTEPFSSAELPGPAENTDEFLHPRRTLASLPSRRPDPRVRSG